MNKSRFIEQLNLYLDNELSDSEVEEFLADMRSDPEKLRVYSEYCRIHKACTCLGGYRFSSSSIRKSWLHCVSALGGIAAAFGLVAFGGIKMVSTLSPVGVSETELASTEEARFMIDPTSRLDSFEVEDSADQILGLVRWDSDAEEWRQGLILSRKRESDALFHQAVFNSTENQGSAGSWETLFNSRSQGVEGRFGVVRASATSSSIYNPVYLRADSDFETSR